MSRSRQFLLSLTLGVAAFSGQTLMADALSPTTYVTLNGFGQAHGGLYNYWDAGYSGAGDKGTDGALLDGGKGNLTDGVIATDNWINTENDAGTGPYVGWLDVNNTVTFQFADVATFDTISAHIDDADNLGAVRVPESIIVEAGGVSHTFNIDDPAGPAPHWVDLDLSGLGIIDDTVSLTFNRRNRWVMVSEVTFSGASLIAVPEPVSSLTLMTLGAGVLFSRKRAKV